MLITADLYSSPYTPKTSSMQLIQWCNFFQEEMLTSSPKFSSPVLDGCWVGSDTISVSTADGCIHTMSAVSKRLSEKKLEGNWYS